MDLCCGEAEEEIRSIALQDSRVHFYGYVAKEEALHLQQQATLLANPRTNNGEYTKYSFSSMTIEYMTSSVPVLMYTLDSILEDDPYLFYVGDDPSAETLCARLREVCEMPAEDRAQFGAVARNYILREKNNVMQVGKIIAMLRKLV